MAKRETPEINSGSMADIAFLLLTFFLLTTTMDQNRGMARRLPPMNDETVKKSDDIQLNARNVLQVHVNKSDRLMVNGRQMDVEMLKDEVKMFILNPNDDPNKSEKEVKAVENFKNVAISKAVVSLQTDRGTSYKMYMEVQNEVMRAYNELQTEFASAQFSKPFADLEEDELKIVRTIFPLNVSEAEPRGKVAAH